MTGLSATSTVRSEITRPETVTDFASTQQPDNSSAATTNPFNNWLPAALTVCGTAAGTESARSVPDAVNAAADLSDTTAGGSEAVEPADPA